MRIGQRKLHALGQRRLQRLVGLVSAIRGNGSHVIRTRIGILHRTGLKPPPDLGHCLGIVLQQLVLRRQAHGVQHCQRRTAQQGGKPAVESADLHGAPVAQQLGMQGTQVLQLRIGRVLHQSAHLQGVAQRRIIGMGKLGQPLLQALAHLASCFLGEGDGQNVLRHATVQQGTHHARHQHPGLACTSARLHRHTAPRIAGDGVKLFTGHHHAVVLKSCVRRCGERMHRTHGTLQKSLRHMPRAWQKSHAPASPSAGNGAPSRMRCMST